MASDSAPSIYELAVRQPRFQIGLIVLLGLAVFGTSFLTVNKRGLLLYDEPTAFAVDKAEIAPAIFLSGFGSGILRTPKRFGARRNIPGQRNFRRVVHNSPVIALPADAGSPAVGTGISSQVKAPSSGFVPTGPGNNTGAGTSALPVALALPAFGGSGFGPSPIGIAANTPNNGGAGGGGGAGNGGGSGGGTGGGGGTTDPVIPAIPEPASWFMMIIAVFTLGSMLRRQGEEQPSFA